jgi:hypothetical protein
MLRLLPAASKGTTKRRHDEQGGRQNRECDPDRRGFLALAASGAALFDSSAAAAAAAAAVTASLGYGDLVAVRDPDRVKGNDPEEEASTAGAIGVLSHETSAILGDSAG